MLPAQVQYWNLKETERHNVVQEDIGYKNWQLGVDTLAETHRHNLVTEAQGWEQINLGWANQGENVRHNQVNEGISAVNAESQQRQASAALQQASVAAFNAETNYARMINDYDVGKQNANSQSQKVENEYELGWANVGVKETQNDIARINAEANTANAATNNQQYLLNERLGIVNTLGGTVRDFWSSMASAYAMGSD